MTTRHLVNPELLPLADSFPPMDLSIEALPAMRAGMKQMLAAQPLPDLPVACRDVFIAAADPERIVRCLAIQPRIMPKGAEMPGAFRRLSTSAGNPLSRPHGRCLCRLALAA